MEAMYGGDVWRQGSTVVGDLSIYASVRVHATGDLRARARTNVVVGTLAGPVTGFITISGQGPGWRQCMEAMYGGNVWRQGSTIVGGGAVHRGGGGGEVRVGNIPCEGMSVCLMPGIVGEEGFDNLGTEETQGRVAMAAWSSSTEVAVACMGNSAWPAACILSYQHVWRGGEMAAWSGSRGVGGKHEFIGISIGGTGGIEMVILTGAVGGTAGAKVAEVAAGNMVDRAEVPKDKAEMAAAAGDAGDVVVSWRTEVGMDEAKMEAADGEMLLESLLECLEERDRTQQLHHLGKGHQSALMQPRVRTRTLKMSICLVASSKQHFLFNIITPTAATTRAVSTLSTPRHPRVTFDPVVTTASGSTQQLNQAPGSGVNDPFISSGSSGSQISAGQHICKLCYNISSHTVVDNEDFNLNTSSLSSDTEDATVPATLSGHRQQQAEIRTGPAGGRKANLGADTLSFFEEDGDK
ncbi:hypothetical protein F5148DRAFT_1154062 [Russula earlei]|uniref:Uncharacterized protein n=1 Tax=Russula earlei TaxID=71964 RepID=A0ACC0TTU9_9AGAM|nr:hypothetical protein F5148DRAFT_1154062 [Russula earlei]